MSCIQYLKVLACAVASTLLIVGCISPTPPLPDGSVYDNIDKFQDALAARVAGLLNPDKQPDFKVVVSQASFPIGTVLRPNSTIPIEYTSCLPQSKPPSVEANNLFPTYTLTSELAVDFGLDNDVIKKLLDAGITIKDTNTVQVSVKDSQIEILSDRDLASATAKADCKSVIATRTVWIIRGYVHGKRAFETKNETANDVKGKVDKIASFNVNLASGNASVSITDEKSKPFLQIISHVSSANGRTEVKPISTTAIPGQIYVQRDRLDISHSAITTVKNLVDAGFPVYKSVEVVDNSKMPKTAQVRYFNDSDKPSAEKAVSLLKRQFNSANIVRVGLPAPSGQLEVWLPKVSQ